MNRRPTTGPVVRDPATFRGRLCGRCLRTNWHPDDVRTGWCQWCHDRTRGVVVALPESAVDDQAAHLLAAVHALATP